MSESRPDQLVMLDQAQTTAAAVLARVGPDDWQRPTPCDEWAVIDVVNKMTASTILFTAFGARAEPDPTLDLVHPNHIVGDDPLGAYLLAAMACRDAWRRPGALEGMAPSTIGEAKARAVLNARIFDTTILSWDVAAACGLPFVVGDELAGHVLRVAQALVPAVRSQSPERYKDTVELDDGAPIVDQMVAATGRSPRWTPPT